MFALVFPQGMKTIEELFNREGKVVDALLNVAKVIFQERRIK